MHAVASNSNRPGRVPPQNLEAERAALGAALLDKQAVWILQEHLQPADFYATKHQQIFECILRLAESQREIDSITLSEELGRRKWIKKIGGATYLAELTSSVSGAANVEYYALIVREKSMLRHIIAVTAKAQSDAFDPSSDVFEVIDETERAVLEVRGDQGAGRKDISALLRGVLDKLESIHGTERGITGVSSGLRPIDELTTGWQKKNFILVAGRPSMGKTAFGLQVAKNAAEQGTPVCFFSVEMGADECAHRLLSAEARVDSHAARSGKLKDDDWVRLARSAGRLAKLPFHIDDTPALSDMQLRSKLRRIHHEQKIGFAVVDYLQLMHATGLDRYSNREQEISTISRGIKALAKELDIPILCMSQLSRAVEARGGDKRPQLSDLRESGSLEQDADIVIFLYRPEYYGIHQDDKGYSTEGICEIIFGKQRNGPIGTRRLAWIKEYGRFELLSRELRTDKPAAPLFTDAESKKTDEPF